MFNCIFEKKLSLYWLPPSLDLTLQIFEFQIFYKHFCLLSAPPPLWAPPQSPWNYTAQPQQMSSLTRTRLSGHSPNDCLDPPHVAFWFARSHHAVKFKYGPPLPRNVKHKISPSLCLSPLFCSFFFFFEWEREKRYSGFIVRTHPPSHSTLEFETRRHSAECIIKLPEIRTWEARPRRRLSVHSYRQIWGEVFIFGKKKL